MTLKTNNVQLGTSLTADKNIVLASDSSTGDFVISKGNHDGVLTEIYRFPNTLIEYADDAAAATGGLPIGGFYRTASAFKVRVA